MDKPWTSKKQVTNKSKTGHEKIQVQVMNKSWTNDKGINKLYTSSEQVTKKSQTSHEQVMNKSWTTHEPVMNK